MQFYPSTQPMESITLREPVTIVTCSTTAAAEEEDLEKASSKKQQQQQQLPDKLKLIPVIFFIYFEVAGGPYGLEPVVKANGPLLAILGFIVFPFIWSIPEALITAELCTALPSNGGFIIWGEKAFGPLGGSLLASWKFFSEVMDISAYPVLCVNYLQRLFPAVGSGTPRNLFVSVFVLSLSILNYTGMGVVGYASVVLGILSVIPFLVMFFFTIPLIKPRMWMSLGEKGVERDWNLYFNILFWNLNAWDHVSTVAGEVDNPRKTFPRALLSAVVLTCSLFLGVLLSVSGAVSFHQREWVSGFFADAAEIIAGKWLMIWVEIGAVLCTIGSFEAQLTSSLYQLVGMAEMGLLPAILGQRSQRFGTPWVAILVSTAVTLGASYMDFPNIISSSNCLYSLGMLLEFASFLRLRWVLPELMRPYRVPVGLPLLIVMSSISCGFFVLMLAIATKLELLVCGGLTLFGIGCNFLMKFFKKRKWLKFNDTDDKEESTDDESLVHESNLGVVIL